MPERTFSALVRLPEDWNPPEDGYRDTGAWMMIRADIERHLRRWPEQPGWPRLILEFIEWDREAEPAGDDLRTMKMAGQTWEPRTPLAQAAIARMRAQESQLAYEREQALDEEAYQGED